MMLVALAGWINEQQLSVIAYLKEENRVLREHLGGKRLRFTDDQRWRLAAKGQALGRRVLRELGTIVTPDARIPTTARGIWAPAVSPFFGRISQW